MSTLEKLLVLGVLVLVGVILAISLFWTRDAGIGGDMKGETSIVRNDGATGLPEPPKLLGTGAGAPGGSPGQGALAAGAASPDQPILLSTRAPIAATPSALVRSSGHPDLWLYTVRAGDTPQAVSTKLTGSAAFAREIWVANESRPLVPGKDILIPNEVFTAPRPAPDAPIAPAEKIAMGGPAPTGDRATVPTGLGDAPVPAAAPAPAPKKAATGETGDASSRTYKVKSSDTLRSIARSQLKDERRWKEIVELNHLGGDLIRAGQTLKLPAAK